MKSAFLKKIEPIFMALVVLSITVSYPIFRQGIMCNDEVYLRVAGQHGLKNFFQVVIVNENIGNGRVLGVLGNLKFLTYISDNIYVFRTIELVVLFLGITVYGYLIYRLLGSKALAVCTSCAALVMLPVTFELAVPNSFMIVVVQPLVLLMLSIICFLNYLESRKKRDLILYTALYLWAMCLYEFVITYVFIFFLINYIKRLEDKNTKQKWSELVRDEIPPVVTAVLYLVLYIVQGILLPTKYAGNQLGITSLAAVLQILGMLFLSALPGYYTFANQKYQFLFNQYKGKSWPELILDPRIILVFLALAYLLYRLWTLSNHKKANGSFGKSCWIVFTAFLYALLPSLPNAVAKGYQGAVTPENLSSLPVSLFLYLAIMFAIGYIVWKILGKINKKSAALLCACAIAFVGAAIQITNGVISDEEYRNYQRFTAMENVLTSDYMQNYDGVTFAAPSFYEVRNMLAIEEGHWSKYASTRYNIEVNNAEDLSAYDYYLTMQDDNTVLLETSAGENYLLCPKEESGTRMLTRVDGEITLGTIADKIWAEKGLQVYKVEM